MCELLGISSAEKIAANDLLNEFYEHSSFHPNGWGLAVFHGDVASIEKQPVKAADSLYLKQRLSHKIKARTIIAHIRLATKGSVDYENCHPFVRQDSSGRRWTLAHNGTVFHGDLISRYFYQQEGGTDSERILYYLIDLVDQRQKELQRPLDRKERFSLVNKMVCTLADGNKLNLLIYDGEMMYVHTNYAHSLYICRSDHAAFLSTRPLTRYRPETGKLLWEELPMNTLISYRHGEQIFSGTDHGKEYIDNDEDLKYLYLDSASL